jgi:thiol:disulfide interchange protein
MAITDGKIATAFGLLGIGLWLLALEFSDSRLLRLALLVGVGMVLPIIINKLRARSGSDGPP